jgi:hypothetical protein
LHGTERERIQFSGAGHDAKHRTFVQKMLRLPNTGDAPTDRACYCAGHRTFLHTSRPFTPSRYDKQAPQVFV